jgi:2-succinyl-6-hydroxy-2,4-cyclohexadiene-1-carboxylate synthase
MIINLNEIEINVEKYFDFRADLSYLLFIHGFTGCAEDWKPIIENLRPDYNCLAIDLIGHGSSSSPDNIKFYTAEHQNKLLIKLIRELNLMKLTLVGYSMGGRAALNFTLSHPEFVDRLILESTNPGLQNEQERNKRINDDEKLAEFIKQHSLEEFVEYWMNLDIFNTQRRFSNEKLSQIKKQKLQNNKTGLSNSLLGFGTGRMPDFHKKLNRINCKTFLISGELDPKYNKFNTDILKLLANAEHKMIKNAGHNTHLEEPAEFIKALKSFLN